jgi:hypothetical protein
VGTENKGVRDCKDSRGTRRNIEPLKRYDRERKASLATGLHLILNVCASTPCVSARHCEFEERKRFLSKSGPTSPIANSKMVPGSGVATPLGEAVTRSE